VSGLIDVSAAWEKGKDGAAPKLKGATWFSFDEMKLMTNNFSEANTLGEGGYGKVISFNIWFISFFSNCGNSMVVLYLIFFFFPCEKLISVLRGICC